MWTIIKRVCAVAVFVGSFAIAAGLTLATVKITFLILHACNEKE